MNPQNAQLVDERREPLYDTYQTAPLAVLPTSIQMFVTPSGPTVGREITNMTAPGTNGLPNPEHHDVYSVQVEFTNMNRNDVTAFCSKYAGRLVVSGFPKLTTPLSLRGDIVNGVNDARVQFDLPEDYRIELNQGQPFYWEFVSRTGYTLTDAALGANIRVKLDGVHTVAIGA